MKNLKSVSYKQIPPLYSLLVILLLFSIRLFPLLIHNILLVCLGLRFGHLILKLVFLFRLGQFFSFAALFDPSAVGEQVRAIRVFGVRMVHLEGFLVDDECFGCVFDEL